MEFGAAVLNVWEIDRWCEGLQEKTPTVGKHFSLLGSRQIFCEVPLMEILKIWLYFKLCRTKTST